MRQVLSLIEQSLPLIDTKPVLLVDSDEAKMLKDHLFLNQRMRTDDNVDLPIRQLFVDSLACGTFYTANEECDVNAKGRQQCVERLSMLTRENLRRGHDRRLKSLAGCLASREAGNDCLAATNIPFKQAVHRFVTRHILQDLPGGGALGISQFKIQGFSKLLSHRYVELDGWPFFGFNLVLND